MTYFNHKICLTGYSDRASQAAAARTASSGTSSVIMTSPARRGKTHLTRPATTFLSRRMAATSASASRAGSGRNSP